jgi:hypothetical protein
MLLVSDDPDGIITCRDPASAPRDAPRFARAELACAGDRGDVVTPSSRDRRGLRPGSAAPNPWLALSGWIYAQSLRSRTALFVRRRSVPIFRSGIFDDQIAIEAFEVIEIPTHRGLSCSKHRHAADWAAFDGRGSGGPGAHMFIGIALPGLRFDLKQRSLPPRTDLDQSSANR